MSSSLPPLPDPFLKFAIPRVHNEDDDSIDSLEADAVDYVLDAMFAPRYVNKRS